MRASHPTATGGLTIFFPAYNDAGTIPSMVIGAVIAARRITDDFEVVVVNDGSRDATAEVLEELSRMCPALRVIEHPENRGYGAALRTGFASATKEFVFYTDGNAQYDPRELVDLWERMTPGVDLVNGYKISRSDSLHRIVVGRLYHHALKLLFGLRLRDIDCDFRLMRRSIFERVHLEKNSGVICLELMKKVKDAGCRVVEAPVHHFHRAYGKSQFFNVRRIVRTLVDILKLWVALVWRRTHLATPHVDPVGAGDRCNAARPPPRLRRTRRSSPLVQERGVAAGSQETPSVPAEVVAKAGSDNPSFYKGRRVLITGGLGFIGSNLAARLVALGADVLLVDSLEPAYGGNLFNIDAIQHDLRLNISDVRDTSSMHYLVQDREVIFNLAGQVSHIDSMRDPYTDLEINCRSQLSILEGVPQTQPGGEGGLRRHAADLRQAGPPPGDRGPSGPADRRQRHQQGGRRVLPYWSTTTCSASGPVSLRLTNVYGPRQLIKHNRQGFIAWFIRLAVEDREIQIYGDGSQLRDFVYVDDVVEAFLRAGESGRCNGEVFNVGGSGPVSLRELVELLIDVAGTGRVRYVDWPNDRKSIDIGGFYADSTKFMRAVGWTRQVGLRNGLGRTVRFYREHLDRYVDANPDTDRDTP